MQMYCAALLTMHIRQRAQYADIFMQLGGNTLSHQQKLSHSFRNDATLKIDREEVPVDTVVRVAKKLRSCRSS